MFHTTITANVTRDPDLRYTQDGKAVVNLSLAHNSRTKDSNGQWVDGETTFLEATVWEHVAEHVAESLHRGDRVIVAGELSVEGYTGSDGTSRTRVRIRVDELGPSLRFASASVRKAERSGPARGGDAIADVATQPGGRPLQPVPDPAY